MLRFACLLLCLLPQCLWGQLNLKQVGHLSYAPLSLAGCWHYVDSLGNQYALVGTSGGLSIVDLNDPTQPKEVFNVPNFGSNWREVKTWAGFAYVGSEAAGSGIHIVDLRHLPDTVYAKIWYGNGAYENRVQSSHALQAENGYLYIFGGNGVTNGATIASLKDPWNPEIVGIYTKNYVHDGFIRGDTLWTSEIYAGQFGVVDISDRSQPKLLTTQLTPGRFNHNGGLSDDNRYFFTTDEKTNSPLAAFDVSDLTNIKHLDDYFPSQKPSNMVHNVRVLGNYLINPSYGGQLTIVDATYPDNLIETAWVVMGNSLVWDADPYLPSGVIFATAKQEGLFIYQPSYRPAAYLEGRVTDALTGQPLSGATVAFKTEPNSGTSNVEGIYKTGAAKTGTYILEITRDQYQPLYLTDVQLKNGEITQLDIALKPLATPTEEHLDEADIKVFPGIFEDHLSVFLPGHMGACTLVLTDMQGKEILRQSEATGTHRLDGLAQLPYGTFVLRVEQQGLVRKTILVTKQ